MVTVNCFLISCILFFRCALLITTLVSASGAPLRHLSYVWTRNQHHEEITMKRVLLFCGLTFCWACLWDSFPHTWFPTGSPLPQPPAALNGLPSSKRAALPRHSGPSDSETPEATEAPVSANHQLLDQALTVLDALKEKDYQTLAALRPLLRRSLSRPIPRWISRPIWSSLPASSSAPARTPRSHLGAGRQSGAPD